MTDTIIVTPPAATQVTVSALSTANVRTTSPITNSGTIAAPIIGINQSLLAISASQVTSGLSGVYAPLASPTFTGTVNGANLTLSGDLTVNGTQTIINTSNLSVSDSLIYLSNSQFSVDALQIGFYGAYGYTGHTGGSGHVHTGLVRDNTDKVWKLFSNASEPDYAGAVGVDFTTATYDTLLAGSFKKNGGTATQILMGDGSTASVDGTTIIISGGVISGANSYSLPTASTTVLGGVKVGSNLSIDGSGVLSATVPAASSTTPLINGTAAVGTSTTYARADHVHPTDTSLASLSGNNSFTGAQTLAPSTTNATALTLTPNGTGNQITGSNFSVLSTGTTRVANLTDTGGVGAFFTMNSTNIQLNTRTASNRGLLVTGVASQTGDLLQLQSSTPTTLAGANAAGQIFTGSTTPITAQVGGAVTATSGTGMVATLTLTTASNLNVGDLISVNGFTSSVGTYNTGAGVFAVVSAVSNVSTFTISYAASGTGTASVFGTVFAPAQASITARSSGTPALVVQGAASSTGANYQEWRNAAGGVVAAIDNGGGMRASGYNNISSFNNSRLQLTNTGAVFDVGVATNKVLIVKGAASQTANLQEWQDSTPSVLASVSSTGNGSFAGVTLSAGTTTLNPLKFTANTSTPTATSGVVDYDGDMYYATTSGTTTGRLMLPIKALAFSNATTSLVGVTPTSIFQTGSQKLTLEANKTYYFRLNLGLNFTFSTVPSAIQLIPTFSQTPQSINYSATFISGASGGVQSFRATSTTAQNITPTLAATTNGSTVLVEGYFQANATTGGTVEFKYQTGSAGGSTSAVQSGSMQEIIKIGSGTPGVVSGTWA